MFPAFSRVCCRASRTGCRSSSRHGEPSPSFSSPRLFPNGRPPLSLSLGKHRAHEEILPVKRDQLPQAVPRDPRLRGDVVEPGVQSVQVVANIGDHVEEQAVPSARLHRQLPAEQEGRQADNHQADNYQHR